MPGTSLSSHLCSSTCPQVSKGVGCAGEPGEQSRGPFSGAIKQLASSLLWDASRNSALEETQAQAGELRGWGPPVAQRTKRCWKERGVALGFALKTHQSEWNSSPTPLTLTTICLHNLYVLGRRKAPQRYRNTSTQMLETQVRKWEAPISDLSFTCPPHSRSEAEGQKASLKLQTPVVHTLLGLLKP